MPLVTDDYGVEGPESRGKRLTKDEEEELHGWGTKHKHVIKEKTKHVQKWSRWTVATTVATTASLQEIGKRDRTEES